VATKIQTLGTIKKEINNLKKFKFQEIFEKNPHSEQATELEKEKNAKVTQLQQKMEGVPQQLDALKAELKAKEEEEEKLRKAKEADLKTLETTQEKWLNKLKQV
jgi:hypothetical protein